MTNQLAEGDRSSQDVYVGPLRVHHKEEAEAVHDHGSISLLKGLVRLEKDNVGFALGAIGFRLTLNGHTVVNLGDTLLHEEWAGLEPDVLMVPIGGRVAHNTMNEVQALEAVRMIAPKLVIPCHYDGAFLWRQNANPDDRPETRDTLPLRRRIPLAAERESSGRALLQTRGGRHGYPV
jgi:L-ascorbate metabolism protein UlaG (beta-lactamase superfamily)